MRNWLLSLALSSALVMATPVLADEYELVKLGQSLAFEGLVSIPDITVTPVAFDPAKNALTFMLRGREGQDSVRAGQVQISLIPGERQRVFLKKECVDGACRSFIATIWVGEDFNLPNRTYFDIHFEIKIESARSS